MNRKISISSFLKKNDIIFTNKILETNDLKQRFFIFVMPKAVLHSKPYRQALFVADRPAVSKFRDRKAVPLRHNHFMDV
jgi:hypothetical protein